MEDGTEVTFRENSIPDRHIFPSLRKLPNVGLQDNISGSNIGLVFTLGTNQILSLFCEKIVFNPNSSIEPSNLITINDFLAIYPNLRFADSARAE